MNKKESISADHAIFENYEDALSQSQVVAEVVATENSQNVITDANGFSTGHTLTEVQESINVLEPTYIAKGTEGPTRFNYEEYTKLEPSSKYLVFLVWDEKNQDYWINSLEQGKFSLDNWDKAEMSLLTENSQYETLKNDVIQHLYGESLKQ